MVFKFDLQGSFTREPSFLTEDIDGFSGKFVGGSYEITFFVEDMDQEKLAKQLKEFRDGETKELADAGVTGFLRVEKGHFDDLDCFVMEDLVELITI